jgi:hypothetical protein
MDVKRSRSAQQVGAGSRGWHVVTKDCFSARRLDAVTSVDGDCLYGFVPIVLHYEAFAGHQACHRCVTEVAVC